MSALYRIAAGFLIAVALASLTANWWISSSYQSQDRAAPDQSPSKHFPLGTDDLGRDRLARLMYGTRVSLFLAPAAALLSCLLGAILGGAAGLRRGWADRMVLAGADLFLCVPWFLLLLIVRATLPLNVSPAASVAITFALLGVLGWAAPARMVRAAVGRIRDSEYMIQAQASGIAPRRRLLRHLIPNLMPVLLAQFWIAIPMYILTETTLGMIGLGVAEPMPSWGGLLRELEAGEPLARFWLFAPALLLALVVASFQMIAPQQDSL